MATKADHLVIFGISGDLAKKMTFKSLYRMGTARNRLPDRRRREHRLERRRPARPRQAGDRS